MTKLHTTDVSAPVRFTGCLLGVALGDCLGAYWEGYPGSELAEAYYEGRFDPVNLRMSPWTDDTAMTTATAQSVIDCRGVDGPDLATKYLRWFESGGRGIGRATYHSMKRLQSGTAWDQVGQQGEYAAGNGVAMRIAPIGLLHTADLDGLEADCKTCGIITHRNDEALAAGVATAYAVAWAATDKLDTETLAVQLAAQLPPTRTADSILQAGQFNSLGDYTIYIREKFPNNEIKGALIYDVHDPEKPVTYMAEYGVILEGGDSSRLILFNGNTQEKDPKTGRPNILYSSTFLWCFRYYNSP